MSPHNAKPTGFAGGKVILLGEHAVVHGAPALAVGIPLGIRVTAEPREGPLMVRIAPWSLVASAADGSAAGSALASLARELGFGESGVSLVGESGLPAHAGLGSSAALATAIARALIAFHAAAPDDEQILRAVQASERVFHGNPSGLDAAVAIRGGVLRFDRERGATRLRAEPPRLVVANSGAEGRTSETVAGFGRWLAEHPDEGRRRLARIAELVEAGIAAVETSSFGALGDAMNECHDHLAWFGVSTAGLDRICEVARGAGALGAKLTGGGGGGCAAALVADPDSGAAVAEALASAGFEVVLK